MIITLDTAVNKASKLDGIDKFHKRHSPDVVLEAADRFVVGGILEGVHMESTPAFLETAFDKASLSTYDYADLEARYLAFLAAIKNKDK